VKLNVHVLGKHVAVLDSVNELNSVLTYLPDTVPENLVSLTMQVRSESYVWDDELHPVFQMNLPEGYLLQILQEEFGPYIGGSPAALLSVVGRNMIGRLQVAPPGADLTEPAKPVDVADLLQGDNSEEAFTQLVREHVKSGVSGVLPKFLDTETKKAPKAGFGPHQKVTIRTHNHIIKGSSPNIPFATVNEYLCMQVVSKLIDSAKTELSQDGRILIVHRFDIDKSGAPHFAMEDFCALLGLRPSRKYETTWERIAKAVRDHVQGARQYETFQKLSVILLLTYALRNADCHSKNIALLYTSRTDARLTPVYDFLTTSVYERSKDAPPGIEFMGKKTWLPGKNLTKFISSNFGIQQREQKEIIERITDSVSENAPLVREMMEKIPGFRDTGKRMLKAWREGIDTLRGNHMYALPPWPSNRAFEGFSDPPKLKAPSPVAGKSELLSHGRRRIKLSSPKS